MIAALTRVFRRTPPPLTAQEEAWLKLEQDRSRRELLVGREYAKRRQAALKATRA